MMVVCRHCLQLIYPYSRYIRSSSFSTIINFNRNSTHHRSRQLIQRRHFGKTNDQSMVADEFVQPEEAEDRDAEDFEDNDDVDDQLMSSSQPQWSEPRLVTYPSSNFIDSLTNDKKIVLDQIVAEIETISRLRPHFPQKIDDRDWCRLMATDSIGARLSQLQFIYSRERQQNRNIRKEVANCAAKDRQRDVDMQAKARFDDGEFVYGSLANCIYWPHTDERELYLYSSRLLSSMICLSTPRVALDCRFLEYLSQSGLSMTIKQLQLIVAQNRQHPQPWPMSFVNFDTNCAAVADMRNRLSIVDNNRYLSADINRESYLTLFNPDKIVYLSPDAKDDLVTIESDNVYVIGAIVDQKVEKNIDTRASLQAAEADNVRVMRLPLDRYIDWQGRNKLLTLPAVLGILMDVYNSNGDWSTTLQKHIPIRNIRPVEQRNKRVRDIYRKFHDFDRQIIQIVSKKCKAN